MPKVPIYRPGQVQERGSSFTHTATATGEAFGAGKFRQLGQLGDAGLKAGKAVSDLERMQQRLDHRKAKTDAANIYADINNVYRQHARSQIQKKGLNAKDSYTESENFYSTSRKTIADKYKGQEGMLSYLMPSVNALASTHLNTLSKHDIDQAHVAAKQAAAGAAQNYQEEALFAEESGDAKSYNISKASYLLEHKSLYEKEGLDAKAVEAKMDSAEHAFNYKVLKNKIERDPIEAEKWYKETKKAGGFLRTETAEIEKDMERWILPEKVEIKTDELQAKGKDLGARLEIADKINDPVIRKGVTQRLKEKEAIREGVAELRYDETFQGAYDSLIENPIAVWNDPQFQSVKKSLNFAEEEKLKRAYDQAVATGLNKASSSPYNQVIYDKYINMPKEELRGIPVKTLGSSIGDLTEQQYKDVIARRASGVDSWEVKARQRAFRSMEGIDRFDVKRHGDEARKLRQQYQTEFDRRRAVLDEGKQTNEEIDTIINDLHEPWQQGFWDFGAANKQAFEMNYANPEDKPDVYNRMKFIGGKPVYYKGEKVWRATKGDGTIDLYNFETGELIKTISLIAGE